MMHGPINIRFIDIRSLSYGTQYKNDNFMKNLIDGEGKTDGSIFFYF